MTSVPGGALDTARCPEPASLDEAIRGELAPSVAAVLLAHAKGCARCGREVAWLDAERSWMAQRAARRGTDERLWEAVTSSLTSESAPPGSDAPPLASAAASVPTKRGEWARLWLGLAAGLLVFAFSAGGGTPGELPSSEQPLGQLAAAAAESRSRYELAMSVDPLGELSAVENRHAACLLVTPGVQRLSCDE